MSDETTPEQRFAERVRRAREDRGWTQAQLAQAMTDEGVSTQYMTVAKIEKGTRAIKLNEAVALCAVLGLPMPGPDPKLVLADSNIAKATSVAAEDLQGALIHATSAVREVRRELAKAVNSFPRPSHPRHWFEESLKNTEVTRATLTRLVWATSLTTEMLPVLQRLRSVVELHSEAFRPESTIEDYEARIRQSWLDLRAMTDAQGDDDA